MPALKRVLLRAQGRLPPGIEKVKGFFRLMIDRFEFGVDFYKKNDTVMRFSFQGNGL